MIIRSLAPGDLDAVLALDDATQREYRGAAWDTMTPQERRGLLWMSREDFPLHLESGLSFVAEDDGRVVGFLAVFREPVMRDPQVYIDGIATAASHRRRGAAEAMLAALVEKARSEGIRQVRSDISLDNQASQRLHAKLGFALTQRIEAVLDL